jgi:hypothetical protein
MADIFSASSEFPTLVFRDTGRRLTLQGCVPLIAVRGVVLVNPAGRRAVDPDQAARTRIRSRGATDRDRGDAAGREGFPDRADRQRADAAGQQIMPVPGLARRIIPVQWQAVEVGLVTVTGQMLEMLSVPRAAALADVPVMIGLDTTDVEIYGRQKRGVASNHQGSAGRRPHVATWAVTEVVLAADLGDSTDDPRAPDLLRRALGCLPERARRTRARPYLLRDRS